MQAPLSTLRFSWCRNASATLNEMRELRLNAMADKLQALYEAPEFVSCDRLQLISDLIGEEFESAIS